MITSQGTTCDTPERRGFLSTTKNDCTTHSIEIGDGTVDPARYPATALLIEQGNCLPPARRFAISLGTVTWRAEQIISHAMKIGDRTTAALMAEAFARMATFSPAALGISSAQGRTVDLALRLAAIPLIQFAHPEAWAKRHESIIDACAADRSLAALAPVKHDENSHAELDDELTELLGMVPSYMEVT